MEELSNITHRKRQVISHSKSLESLNNLTDSLSQNISCDEYLQQSLDLSTNMYSTRMDDMRQEINQLKNSLEITQNELENKILENIELTKQITQQSQELNILKKLYTSSPKSTANLSSSSRKNVRRRLSESFRKSPIQQIIMPRTETEKEICENRTILLDKIPPLNSTPRTSASEKAKTPTPLHQLEHNRKQIFLLGTQQGAGLAVKLIKSRINTSYEKYQVSSFTKPFAQSEAVLHSGWNLNPAENDKIVLFVGENDRNPIKLLIELGAFLKRFENTTVFVVSVTNNIYLNIEMLNEKIKTICHNFKNCSYIELEAEPLNYYYSDYVCSKLNFKIDSIDYERKYLNFVKNNLLKRASTRCKNSVSGEKYYTQRTLLDYYQYKNNNIQKPKSNAFQTTAEPYVKPKTKNAGPGRNCSFRK